MTDTLTHLDAGKKLSTIETGQSNNQELQLIYGANNELVGLASPDNVYINAVWGVLDNLHSTGIKGVVKGLSLLEDPENGREVLSPILNIDLLRHIDLNNFPAKIQDQISRYLSSDIDLNVFLTDKTQQNYMLEYIDDDIDAPTLPLRTDSIGLRSYPDSSALFPDSDRTSSLLRVDLKGSERSYIINFDQQSENNNIVFKIPVTIGNNINLINIDNLINNRSNLLKFSILTGEMSINSIRLRDFINVPQIPNSILEKIKAQL